MTVTHGTVSYERNVRPADFESKKASVVLSFTVEDGSDPAPVVARVFDMAVGEVHRRLGLATVVEEAKPAETKKRAKAPPAEVPAADPTAMPATDQSSDPAGMPESGTAFPSDTGPTATTAASPSDPAAIGEPEEAAEPVVHTDKDLRTAVNYAIGEKKVASARIVTLIIEFTNPPGTPEGERVPGKNIPMIEQDRRGEFLARLKALYDA